MGSPNRSIAAYLELGLDKRQARRARRRAAAAHTPRLIWVGKSPRGIPGATVTYVYRYSPGPR